MNRQTIAFYERHPEFGVERASDIFAKYSFSKQPQSRNEFFEVVYPDFFINTREVLKEAIADYIEKGRKALRNAKCDDFFAEIGVDPVDAFALIDVDALSSVYWRQFYGALSDGTFRPEVLHDAEYYESILATAS